jgi:predicted Zn-dependent peptidase
MFPEVHRSAHQGIPVFWADLPGPLTGTLTFGVGMRDEPAPLMGITHLTEHLAFRPLEPLVIRHDGMVDHEAVVFHATGEPEEVAAFLNGIARAVMATGKVTDEDLAREKAVHHAEYPSHYERPGAGLLTYRFGVGGLGNANANDATISSITSAELGDWSQTWMTAENAALSFTGPPPPGLDLALLSGSVPRHAEPAQVAQTPCLVESLKEGVAISLVVPIEAVHLLSAALEFELQLRLRHELGLIYSIDTFFTRVDKRATQLDLVLDPLPDQIAATVEAVIAVLHRVNSDGFSDHAIDHARSDIATSLAWANTTTADYVDALASGHLTGRMPPTPETLLASAHALEPDILTRTLTEALPSLIVAFDADAELDKSWLRSAGLPVDKFDAWLHDNDEPRRRRARKGRIWRARRRGDMPGQWAILTEDSLKTQEKGDTGSIRFDDLAVLGRRECGCLALIDSRGRSATVDPTDWVRGNDLIDRLVARVPSEIVRAFPSH